MGNEVDRTQENEGNKTSSQETRIASGIFSSSQERRDIVTAQVSAQSWRLVAFGVWKAEPPEKGYWVLLHERSEYEYEYEYACI